MKLLLSLPYMDGENFSEGILSSEDRLLIYGLTLTFLSTIFSQDRKSKLRNKYLLKCIILTYFYPFSFKLSQLVSHYISLISSLYSLLTICVAQQLLSLKNQSSAKYSILFFIQIAKINKRFLFSRDICWKYK